MSGIKATVLVPTHEHGPLLGFAVRSALAQTVDEIEVFIVCDGATNDTLEAAEELSRSDDRVRLFVNDKGPRHGELHRHHALQEASGGIVCYLSDDDLWLPDHVATMIELLESADFAHAYPLRLDTDGRVFSWPGHLSLPAERRSMLEGLNFIPLSCGAHTLEFYHRLPHGWRSAPADTHSDLYMWQQILSVEGVRAASGGAATVLHLPSIHRGDLSMEERVDELARWSSATTKPDFGSDLDQRIREHLVIEWAQSVTQNRVLAKQGTDTADRVAALETERATLEARVNQLQDQLRWITNSRTWRFRASVLRVPGVSRLVRTVGTARSR